jgi:hypothetical protein
MEDPSPVPPPKPPFDTTRAAFFLVGMVLVSYLVIAYAYLAFCWIHGAEIMEGRWKCDAESRIYELLTQALSAALAFAGGFVAGRKS